MPRRKQDKPQHLEEDIKMEQLISGSGALTTQEVTAEGPLTRRNADDREGKDDSIHGEFNTADHEQEAVTRSDVRNEAAEEQKRLEEEERIDVEENGPAVIGNEEWLNVKATLASIQKQMQILRLQQFQFMQFLASQNSNTNTYCTPPFESVPTHLPNDDNQSQIENETPTKFDMNGEETEVKAEKDLEIEEADDKSSDIVSGGDPELDEQSPSAMGGWPDNDEQGEPVSFDCTRCSAVLPSPELLKIHMYSHQKRMMNSESGSAASDKPQESSQYPNGGSALQGSGSFGSLPPSYQSIIDDLSNDSLEEYMEIQKPENTHLEHLVKNMDGTVTDPNQCLICKRILSCKSALMMHYRTHTGERPFKCKLCSRAFTTKGNLKTHMGVHRAKPPLRLLHSCMVCSKQFTNALVLNQHMKMHSDEASKKRTYDVQSSEECNKRQRLSLNAESSYKSEPADGFGSVDLARRNSVPSDFNQLSTPGGSTAGVFPFDFGGIPSIHDHLRYAEVFARQWEQFNQYPMFNPMVPVKPPMFSTPISLHGSSGPTLPFPLVAPAVSSNSKPDVASIVSHEEPPQHEKTKQPDIDGDDKSSVTSGNEKSILDANRQSNTSPKSERSWGSNETTSNSVGMKLDPPPGTTCDICSKTFACRSALEIHYRSHTKHRPFKCDLCDKAFTTRGNMKQHILTHKTDDIQWNSGERNVSVPEPSPPSSDIAPISDDKKTGGRHQCSVCLKHFSSASAVHIHFRTHTGDRPFRCNVCSKAFTTKGNLKVHMGTHMWNGSPSIRVNKLNSCDSTEVNGEGHEEETIPISPSRVNPMLNNGGMGWNPFNQNLLMKASMFNNPAALMANYSGLFLPTGGVQPNAEEPSRPWLWQVTCHICNKDCHSPASLELHLKTHFVNESGSSKPVTAS